VQLHVRDVVRQVLGVEPARTLELAQGLRALGMDSLMAVELRNHLQAGAGRPLPSTVAFDYPTIGTLAAFLAHTIGVDLGTADVAAVSDTGVAAPQDDLRDLSDEDAEALLAEELNK
jgi:acyl carrier protein